MWLTYKIDGSPLVGPIPNKRNAYCIIGLRAGLGEGGGHGWLLAQQIVHGEACYDTWCIDPRRFTGYTNVELNALKAIEDCQNEFRFHFPNKHRPAGRNAKTTPLTPVLATEGVEFTVVNGWERVEVMKPSDDFHVTHGFGFDESFDVVKGEVEAVHSAVGICEVNGFNRFEITGADRHEFLDRMICGRLNRKDGRVGLAYLLNHHGMVKAEATIANLPASDRGPARVWYGSAAAAEFHDMDWLQAHIGDADVQIKSLTNDQTILVIAGPNASLFAAYSALRKAGDAHGMKMFGALAVDSMRMEKGFLHWKADLLTEFDPFETGLDRFVTIHKPDFVARAALVKRRAEGPRKKLVCLQLESSNAPAHGGASVMIGDRVVGTVSSGDWGHRTGLNLAYAFVDVDMPEAVHIDVLGHMVAAKVIPMGPYDPDYTRMRS